MSRRFLIRVHLIAATGAIVLILAFLAISVLTELAGGIGQVHALRRDIVAGLPLLIACLATAGITGRRLAGRSRAAVIRAKQRRLAAAAGIGLMLLVPCAVLLYQLTAVRIGGGVIMALQAIEWAFGGINLCLLTLNWRAGYRMRARRSRAVRPHQLAGSGR